MYCANSEVKEFRHIFKCESQKMAEKDRKNNVFLWLCSGSTLQHAATHCNIPQLASTHRPQSLFILIIQHTATHYNTLQHAATHCNTLQLASTTGLKVFSFSSYNTLQHTATPCNTLQLASTHRHQSLLILIMQHTATHCNTLQHTATHCNTLQHPATPRNTPQHPTTRLYPQASKSFHSHHATHSSLTSPHNPQNYLLFSQNKKKVKGVFVSPQTRL